MNLSPLGFAPISVSAFLRFTPGGMDCLESFLLMVKSSDCTQNWSPARHHSPGHRTRFWMVIDKRFVIPLFERIPLGNRKLELDIVCMDGVVKDDTGQVLLLQFLKSGNIMEASQRHRTRDHFEAFHLADSRFGVAARPDPVKSPAFHADEDGMSSTITA